MALLRPSLTLVLDLDERVAAEQTILEINRSYAHIGTPVIRTHACESAEDAPVRNLFGGAGCMVVALVLMIPQLLLSVLMYWLCIFLRSRRQDSVSRDCGA